MSCCGTVSDSRNGSIRTSVTTFVACIPEEICSPTGHQFLGHPAVERGADRRVGRPPSPISPASIWAVWQAAIRLPDQQHRLAISLGSQLVLGLRLIESLGRNDFLGDTCPWRG